MFVVAMPQMGETVTEGTIIAWAVAVGDRVEVDGTLFEVSTEKVDTEVPSAVAGHVRAVLVAEGETVPVGTPLAVITPGPDDPFDISGLTGAHTDGHPVNPDGEPVDPVGAPHAAPGASQPDRAEGRPDGTDPSASGDPMPTDERAEADGRGRPATGERSDDRDGEGGVPPVSPVVARLLAEHGLDPAKVPGSGRRGRITRSDVLAAAAAARSAEVAVPPGSPGRPSAPPTAARATDPSPGGDRQVPDGPASPPTEPRHPSSGDPASRSVEPAAQVDIGPGDEVVELTKARAVTAEHMRRSLSTAAHALVVVEVDYHNVEAVRRSLGLSYLPFVARAVVEALRSFPHLNASVDHDRLVVRRRVRLGIAVDLDREALVVPVVHEAGDLRLPALGAAITDVADRARRRRLTAAELEGGTFTVTNVGSYGTVMSVPIINQPQVGILSTDGVRMRPVAVRTGAAGGPAEWGVAVRPVGNLSLSFDHRAVDGAYAAAFLSEVRDVVEGRDWAREL